MTNYERIKRMTVEEMAVRICRIMADCELCAGAGLCKYGGGRANGLIKWLESEVEDNG